MTDLPAGWEWAKLGEIGETALGKMLDRGKNVLSNPAPYLRNSNVQWGSIDLSDVNTMDIAPSERGHFQLLPGDLLVCEGGEVGRCAIWPGSDQYMAFQKALHRIRPYDGVEPRYLRYLLEHFSLTGALAAHSTGSTIKHLPQQQLRQLPVPVPPLAEQRRIVAALEGHLSRFDQTRTQLSIARSRIARLEDRLFTSAFAGRLHEHGVDDLAPPPKPSDTIDESLPAVPSHWQWTRLAEVAEVVGGITKGQKTQDGIQLVEVPYLRVANVQRGHLDLSNIARIHVTLKKLAQLELKTGDVLLNEGGDRDKLGRGWVWEGQIEGCIHQNHVFRARVRESRLDPKLLAWYANGPGRRWFEANGRQTVNLASISLSKIGLLPVPVPPKAEQLRMIEALDTHLTTLRSGEKLLAACLTRAEVLRRSLLTEAFAGRLVPQDPGDEPAAELLARIRAGRAAEPKRRTRRKAQPVQKETLL